MLIRSRRAVRGLFCQGQQHALTGCDFGRRRFKLKSNSCMQKPNRLRRTRPCCRISLNAANKRRRSCRLWEDLTRVNKENPQ